MKLSDLLEHNGDTAKVEIVGLSADSREVQPGFLYAALRGTRHDGTAFIDEAVSHGAVAVLAPPGVRIASPNAYLVTDNNPRRRLSFLAARFYGAQPETVVAVTGTNGKSSVADFVRQIWSSNGRKAAALGTLGVTGSEPNDSGSLTTPDPITLHQNLLALRERGVDSLALEASSHGLSQYRLDGVRLCAAAFTNLTRDHLDYHDTVEDYLYAKLRLFGELLPPHATAVLNADADGYEEAANICWARGHRILSVGREGDLRIVSQTPSATGQDLEISYEGHNYQISLPLIGEFQASNALIAAGLAIASGVPSEKAFEALNALTPVRGRVELAAHHPNGAGIYVDYAHTPDALENVLAALRPHTAGRLHVVFGCGGDRDRGKRALMGSIAARLADCVIVTDDNPRSEDAADIRREIMSACPGATEIADRANAIEDAVAGLRAGDVLVIAGKGHEQGQIIGDRISPFDDVGAARKAADMRKLGA